MKKLKTRMKISLSFLLSIASLLIIINASSLPLIPGASTLISGFNIVEGESTYSPIFQWTFAKNKTWTNPQYWNLVYSVPDQITITNEPFTEQTSLASIFDTVIDSQKYQALSFGIGIKDFKMGMSAESSSSSDVRQTFFNRRFAASTRLKTGVYSQVLIGKLREYLDSYFLEVIEKLPSSISSKAEKDEYRAFLYRFGTHFSGNILFGGMIEMTTQMDFTLSSSYSSTELQQQLNAQFSVLSGNITSSSSSTQLSSNFVENSLSSIFLIGGNTSDYNPDQWTQWVHTVYFDPVPLSSSLVPISSLAPDQTIANNINEMINEYLTDAAIEWCDADMCNGHGKCVKDGTDNPFQSCECEKGITGANCTESDQGVDELYAIGPVGHLSCSGTTPSSFSFVSAPGDYISNLQVYCYTYDNEDTVQSISVTFNNGTTKTTNTPSTSKYILQQSFLFNATDPYQSVVMGASWSCVTFGTSTMNVYLQMETRNGVTSPQCGSPFAPSYSQIPSTYQIIGLFGTVWDSQVASLGFYYRSID